MIEDLGDGNLYTPRNIGDGQTWGVELDFSAPLTAFGLPDTGLFANYTYLDSETRSEEHTSELQSLMRISYAVFCLKKKSKSHDRYDKHITTAPERTTKSTHERTYNTQQEVQHKKVNIQS